MAEPRWTADEFCAALRQIRRIPPAELAHAAQDVLTEGADSAAAASRHGVSSDAVVRLIDELHDVAGID